MSHQLNQSINQMRQDLNQAAQIAQQLQQVESTNQQMALQAQQNPQTINATQMGTFASREANATQKLRQVTQLIQEISQELNEIQSAAQSQQFQQQQQPFQQQQQQPFNPSQSIQGIQQGNIYQRLKQQTAQPQGINQGGAVNPLGFQPQPPVSNQGQIQPQTPNQAWQTQRPQSQVQGNVYQSLKQQTTNPASSPKIGFHPSISGQSQNTYQQLRNQSAQ